MIIGIDASNIRTGGGKKHLEQFIFNSIKIYGNKVKYVVVSNQMTLLELKKVDNVTCITNSLLNFNNITSFVSQYLFSKSYFKKNKCQVVFVPGGIFLSSFKPFVTMSQNMLPFDPIAIKNFKFFKKIKFYFIQLFQLRTFKKSDGLIFLTNHAKNIILNQIKTKKKFKVIPHGITQSIKSIYNAEQKKFRIMYISDFLPYKHHISVVKAFKEIINKGYDVHLSLIGTQDRSILKRINKIIYSDAILKDRIELLGFIPNNKLIEHYKKTSLVLFASTCENLPFILLESLSYGMPIITSNKKPMCEMVYGENILFDSYKVTSIEEVILKNMDTLKLLKMSNKNFVLSKKYNWSNNVINTLDFIKSCV